MKTIQNVTCACRSSPVTQRGCEVYGGLWAATKTIEYGKPVTGRGRWRVTHVPSGYSVSRRRDLTKADARKLAKMFTRTATHEDWREDDLAHIGAKAMRQGLAVLAAFYEDDR